MKRSGTFVVLRRLVGRFQRPAWVEKRLISSDGQMIYTVRDREGD